MTHDLGYSAHQDGFARAHLPPPEQWPDFLLNGNPDVAYPARLNAAVALVDDTVAQGHGARVAFEWLERGRRRCLSYQALAVQVNRIAHVLTQGMGLVPGNRLLLRGPNGPMMAASWLAAVKAGLVTVPTMPLLRRGELAAIVRKARVQAAVCHADLLGELQACTDVDEGGSASASALRRIMVFGDARKDGLEAALARSPAQFAACDTAADDVCLIAFTSGSTGEPKACLHFHRDVLAMCDTFGRHVLRLTPDDVIIGTPALAFTFGLGGLLCFPLRAAATTVLVPYEDVPTLLRQIRDFEASVLFGPPTLYRQMAACLPAGGLPSLRRCVSAGEALPDATRQLWKQVSGLEMIDGLGGTEMLHVYISSPPEAVRRGAIGQVVPGYEARIVDAALRPLPPGQVGQLAVRGPTGCRYLDDARQASFVRDGWNLPGDCLSMDEDGYFYYQARNDDIIVSSGYSIAAAEVENALLCHAAVRECGVVARPDPLRGNIVHAWVVLAPGHPPGPDMVQTLQAHVKRCIAPYKYPRAISFVDALPRSGTGKLQRFVLRDVASRAR